MRKTWVWTGPELSGVRTLVVNGGLGLGVEEPCRVYNTGTIIGIDLPILP